MRSFSERSRFAPTGRRQAGVSLIELLVSLAIGAVLIFGAIKAYVDSRSAYAINETIAHMQEAARYAISAMEPDLRMANYWGLLKGAESIAGQAAESDTQSSLAGNAARTCGKNFALDLENNIEGSNDGYVATCKAKNDNPMPHADTITIRRAAAARSSAGPAALRICSTRTAGALVVSLSDSTTCAMASANPSTAQVNDLIVHLYYVDRDSDQHNGVPSLRRKFLDSALDFGDEEILANVEDMQIQYGVDTSGGVGPASGAATRYLDAGPTLTALLRSTGSPAQIVSVRLWLLIRADTPEVGFTDTRIYEYGNRRATHGRTADLASGSSPGLPAYQPSLSSDDSVTSPKRYRRVLVSRTFQVRNALGT
jgi:type IV pilus assembly protein PilW